MRLWVCFESGQRRHQWQRCSAWPGFMSLYKGQENGRQAPLFGRASRASRRPNLRWPGVTRVTPPSDRVSGTSRGPRRHVLRFYAIVLAQFYSNQGCKSSSSVAPMLFCFESRSSLIVLHSGFRHTTITGSRTKRLSPCAFRNSSCLPLVTPINRLQLRQRQLWLNSPLFKETAPPGGLPLAAPCMPHSAAIEY